MKKLYLYLLGALLSVAASAQTVGDAFYIYRNDGQFNAFFRDEVDSIHYSCYDLDSVLHDDYITQVIYTPDSTYRIPLEAIDSVGFVQPENVLKKGVISLTGTLRDYLVKYDSIYLYFLDTTPSNILPRVGDRLATTEMSDIFPCGFFAEVVAVRKEDGFIVVECSGLELEDVFDSYCYIVDVVSTDESASAPRRDVTPPNVDKVINVPYMSHSWSFGAGYSLFSVSNTVEASLKPTFRIRGNDLVDPERGRQTDIRVTCNYTTGTKYDFAFEVAPDPFDVPFPLGRGESPVAPAISFFWDFGVFAAISGSVSYSQSFTQDYVLHIDYKREGIKMPTINFDRPTEVGRQKSEPRIAVKGSLRGGIYGEVGFKPWAVDKNALGKVSGRLEIGVEAEMERGIDLGDLEAADQNTALYDFVDRVSDLALPDLALPSLTISPYASVSVTVAVGPWHSTWTPWKGKIGSPIYEGGFFPHFSNIRYERPGGDGRIKFLGDLSRTCPFPWQIGFSVFDLNGNHVKTEYFDRTYITPYLFDEYDVTIDALSQDGEYKVYPSINVFDHRVLASPYVMVKPCPVKLSDFKVTKSQYKSKGFTNDGLTYDYRFDVSITATLANSENVHDWGYVYRDPNGREKKISLVEPSGYGTSYTDTRWAYFRNDAKSTCTLYAYVEYVDSDEPVFGEPHDYPLDYEGGEMCPDSNHPHAIDLGLPSGTKWACCNVGASSPEGYGGYYAWGETSTKSVYNGDTYQYYQNGSFVNIGSDIAGTSYDAATANWGASWCMPSQAQIRELQDNCSSERTQQNGVNGLLFTGPNGNSVFLPAAGYRRGGELGYEGNVGYYWSSTLREGDPYGACYFDFVSGNTYWNYGSGRHGGRTVRPVRKN